MDSELVLERRDANVLWLTLNQPEKRNPLSSSMITTLSGLLERGYADETVRVIVLASTGPVFSAGHDLSEMNQRADEDAVAFSGPRTPVDPARPLAPLHHSQHR